MFKDSAESEGYVLIGSNSLHDSTTITKNILAANRLIIYIKELIPVNDRRIYSAGFSAGARFAALVPSFIKGITGVISLGAAIPNYELLTR